MRDAARMLVAMGQLPNEDVGDDAIWEPWEEAVRALANLPPTMKPPSSWSSCHEARIRPTRWPGIYSTSSRVPPGWPDWDLLDDRSPWVAFLRQRAERGRA